VFDGTPFRGEIICILARYVKFSPSRSEATFIQKAIYVEHFASSVNAEQLKRAIMSSLSFEDLLVENRRRDDDPIVRQVSLDQLVAMIHDAAATNTKASSLVGADRPHILDINCLCHMLSRVGSHLFLSLNDAQPSPSVEVVYSEWKRLFAHSYRVRLFMTFISPLAQNRFECSDS